MAEESRPPVIDEVRGALERIWLAGLGAFSLAEEEGSRLFQQLIDAGERFTGSVRQGLKEGEEEGETLYRRLVDAGAGLEARVRGTVDETIGGTKRVVGETRERIEERVDEIEGKVKRVVEQVLERIGVPTRAEMDDLNRSIDRLARMVESLVHSEKHERSGYSLQPLGGGWYEILHGAEIVDKVQGREHAEARLNELAG